MARGARLLRFALVAVTLVLILYKLSVGSFDLGRSYDVAKNSLKGTTGGVSPNPQEPLAEKKTPEKQTQESSKQQESPKQQQQQQTPETPKKEEQALTGGNSLTQNTQPPQSPAPYERANATFVSLARNSDIWSLLDSIRQVEDRFNHQFHYDWVFLNDKDFDEQFIKLTTAHVSGTTHYHKIPEGHWGAPEWIDQEKAALVREQMREKKVIYGDSISYRHMCRYESGFFWRHPALNNYKYYWRVEPDIKLFCDIPYDVFKYMEEKKLKYGFTIALYEYIETIPTLWNETKNFINANPQYVAPDSLMDFISDDHGETYNRCHFWSNFEVADLDFWRGEAYTKYFDHLDKVGGFFYERWGDAPVHSIAASLFLNKDEVHYFDDIGYWHVPFPNCPTDEAIRLERRCNCKPEENFTWKGYSCVPRYYKVNDLKRPKGWETQT